MSKPPPTAEVLRQLLRYDPETGCLFWLPRSAEWFTSDGQAKRWNSRHANVEALTADTGGGYRCGFILGQKYKAHRVIWCMQTGAWPTELLDHRDGDRANNRWINLREASPSQNARNIKSRPGSSSRYTGVSVIKRNGMWVAKINLAGRIKHLGTYVGEAEAARAYDAAAREFHGEFARPNFAEVA